MITTTSCEFDRNPETCQSSLLSSLASYLLGLWWPQQSLVYLFCFTVYFDVLVTFYSLLQYTDDCRKWQLCTAFAWSMMPTTFTSLLIFVPSLQFYLMFLLILWAHGWLHKMTAVHSICCYIHMACLLPSLMLLLRRMVFLGWQYEHTTRAQHSK